jgi:hypothetical protein
VYDCKSNFRTNDASKLQLGSQVLLGKCHTCIAELVANKTFSKSLVNTKGKFAGSIQVPHKHNTLQ